MKFTTLGIMLSYKCNVRCRSCLWGSQVGRPEAANVDEVCKWIDQAYEIGTLQIVGFSGGESFIHFSSMRRIMYYAAKRYGLPSGVATNCLWATSPQVAKKRLSALYDVGLRSILVSVDDFHQEWVPLERVKNCILSAQELGMDCVIQCVITKRTKKLKDYISTLGIKVDEKIHLSEFDCIPIGSAAVKIDNVDFKSIPGIPSDYCSILQVVNILPNGAVHLCCGAPFAIEGLRAGNINQLTLGEILDRAEWDPVFNSLAINRGPMQLKQTLKKYGKDGFLMKSYSSSCHACWHILSKPRIVDFLRDKLEQKSPELFAKRTILFRIASEKINDKGGAFDWQ